MTRVECSPDLARLQSRQWSAHRLLAASVGALVRPTHPTHVCPGVLYVRPVCASAVRASVLVLVRERVSPPAAPLGAFLRPVREARLA